MATQFQYQEPPNAQQFGIALKSLAEVQAGVVAYRAMQQEIVWIEQSAREFVDAIEQSYRDEEIEIDTDEIIDPASILAMNFLLSEIWALAYRFQEVASENTRAIITQNAANLPGLSLAQGGDYLSDRTVEDFETVTGSVEKLMKKLPKWLQRVLDVLLEALKLTRGVV